MFATADLGDDPRSRPHGVIGFKSKVPGLLTSHVCWGSWGRRRGRYRIPSHKSHVFILTLAAQHVSRYQGTSCAEQRKEKRRMILTSNWRLFPLKLEVIVQEFWGFWGQSLVNYDPSHCFRFAMRECRSKIHPDRQRWRQTIVYGDSF
jgi:hypothetical protein